MIGEDVGIVNDEGELHFPKTPNAAISSPPAVSINNPKKRRRKDEPEAPSSGTITLTAASPLPQVGSVSKKRILHELPDEETSAPTNAVTKKDHKDKKDKHKDKKEKKEKHKDKKDKHRSKHKDKSAVAAGE